jgi:hypothetical protein
MHKFNLETAAGKPLGTVELQRPDWPIGKPDLQRRRCARSPDRRGPQPEQKAAGRCCGRGGVGGSEPFALFVRIMGAGLSRRGSDRPSLGPCLDSRP